MVDYTPEENIPILLKDTESGKVITVPGSLTPMHLQGMQSGKYQQVFEQPKVDNTQLDAPAPQINTLYNTENGQVVRLPMEQIPQAIVDGKVGFKKGDRINMVNEAGESVNLPAENVAPALAQGYQLEHPAATAVREYAADNQGIAGTLKVGLSQFADEALFGLPEIVFDHTASPLEVAKKEAVKEQHQIANTVGGLAGFGASLLYGGEFFKVATTAGRGAERLILGGAERALEQTIAKTGEKLVIEGGEKLAVDGVKALTVKGLDKESTKVAEGALQAFEDATTKRVQETLIAQGVSEGAAKQAAPGLARRMIATTAKYGVEGAVLATPQAATEEMLGDHKAAAESLLFGIGGGAALGITGAMGREFLSLTKNSLKYLPEVMPAAKSVLGEKFSPEGMRLSAIGATKSDLNQRGVDRLNGAIADMNEKGVFDFGQKGINLKEIPTFGKIVERIEGINKTSGEKIGEIFTSLDERMAQNPNLYVDAFNPAKLASELKTKYMEEFSILQKDGSRVIDPVRKAEWREVNKWIKSLELRGERPTTFEEARKIKNNIGEQTKWDHTISNQGNWLRQDIYNAVKTELDDAVSRVGKRVGEESLLDQYMALKKDWGSSSELMRILDKEKSRQFGNRLIGLTDFMTGGTLGIMSSIAHGHLLGALIPIMGIGAKKALETSVAKSIAAKAMDKAGLLFTEQAMKRTAQMIDEISGKLEGITTVPRVSVNGMAKFLGRDGEGKDKYEQFKAIQQKLTAFQIDPQYSADKLARLAAPINNGAPKISEEYVGQMIKLYQFLYDKLPHNTKDQPYFKKGVEYKPSDMEISKFSRVLATVDNPFSVIDDIMNGTVSKDQVEVLRTIYPSIHAAMINKINDLAYSQKVDLPYQTRLKLSLVMGVNFDPSLKNVNALQANFATPSKKSSSGSAPVPRGAQLELIGKTNPMNTQVGSLLSKK